VDEILALDPSKLKFAKRTLRLQRCKRISGSKGTTTLPAESDATEPALKRRKPSTKQLPTKSVPKGDPSLGEKLKMLSKEERKVRKANDPTRIARRLAKKKMRNGTVDSRD